MEITRVSTGMYQMDGKTYDIGTLMMAIGLKRAETIETQLVDQAEAMQRRNKLLEAMSKALAAIRGMGDSSNNFNATTFNTGVPKPGGGNYTLKELMDANGMGPLQSEQQHGGVDWIWGKDERNEAIELIKAKMDSLNSDSQMDMIRLQGLVNKRDQAYELTTNLMSKDSKAKDAIIGNIR